jgi:ribosomal protein L16 Arg81 hydroxylase
VRVPLRFTPVRGSCSFDRHVDCSVLKEQLERLISPLPVDRFVDEHWNTRPVFIAGAADKFREICDPEMWRSMRHATELDAARVDEHGVQTQFRIERSQIAPLYDDSHTICGDVSHDPSIAPLLARFGRDLGLAGGLPFAKLYASPDGGGFTLHLDTFHVFVLQLSGSKRWRFSKQPAVEAPLHPGRLDSDGGPVWGGEHDGDLMTLDDGAPVAAPDLAAFDEATLTPGDCLYLPPGTWHLPNAIGHSVALSISPPRAPVYHLVARALEDLLMQRSAWRQDVFALDHEAASAGAAPRAVVDTFAARVAELSEMLPRLDQRALHRVWRINQAALQEPQSEQPAAGALQARDVLEHASAQLQRYLVAPAPGGAEEIFFYAGGAEWSLPIEALTFVETLAGAQRFRVDEARAWDEKLSWDDVKEILGQLLAADLLRRV